MKTALITGIAGQDGAYLALHLLHKGYKVVGARRHGSTGESWRLQQLGIEDRVEIVGFDVLEDASVRRVIDHTCPDEVYNLAAQSSIAYGLECPQYTANTNGLGVLRILEAIREVNPAIKFFQASSSEMFGDVRGTNWQHEGTAFNPRSPYGTAKLFAHWSVRNYRELHGIHASSGILYNHTSPLQGSEFLARKVTKHFGTFNQGVLEIGNLDARRDWGYAPDYVDAMWTMLQQPRGDDYIVATGKTTSVREFITAAAAQRFADLTWSGEGVDEVGVDQTGRVVVRVNPKFYRPVENGMLCGDNTKIRTSTGWFPGTPVAEIIAYMLRAEHATRKT
ncbi:MAG TPA: GDP-mannose 4,6-dehydratase [Thermoanaerobaculaceae bacterium]|nr:GDP-mannose 4,6-dehydratase [Thermoanaerobaculaceae bacterium]